MFPGPLEALGVETRERESGLRTGKDSMMNIIAVIVGLLPPGVSFWQWGGSMPVAARIMPTHALGETVTAAEGLWSTSATAAASPYLPADGLSVREKWSFETIARPHRHFWSPIS